MKFGRNAITNVPAPATTSSYCSRKPQGYFSTVLSIAQPGSRCNSNVKAIIQEDVPWFFVGPHPNILPVTGARPTIDVSTGEIIDKRGAPEGLCLVAKCVATVAHQLKIESYQSEPKLYSVNLGEMGGRYVAFVLLWADDDSRAWNLLERRT